MRAFARICAHRQAACLPPLPPPPPLPRPTPIRRLPQPRFALHQPCPTCLRGVVASRVLQQGDLIIAVPREAVLELGWVFLSKLWRMLSTMLWRVLAGEHAACTHPSHGTAERPHG